MPSAGRDQAAAMERLAQILFLLTHSPAATATADRLLDVASYGAEAIEDRRRQLFRDIEQLRAAGWDIRNDAEPGADARYRLVSGDYRLRVQFAPDEQGQLQRVARLAGLAGVTGPAGQPGSAGVRHNGSAAAGFVPATVDAGPLDLVLHAVRRRCLLHFDYRGTARVVHPHHVHSRSTGWYLSAREDGAATAKAFRVDRMSRASADEPGSAEPQPESARLSIDPVAWQVDPPVTVEVETTADHREQVVDLLGGVADASSTADGGVTLRVRVVNRAAFRARLYELGERVRLLGPPEVRDEVRAELLAVVRSDA